jgi:hypothetical protein
MGATPKALRHAEKALGQRLILVVLGLMQLEKQFHVLEPVVHVADDLSLHIVNPLIGMHPGGNCADESQDGEGDGDCQRQNLNVSQLNSPAG